MEINGLTWQTLSDALRIRKHAYESETVISGVEVNAKSVSKKKREVKYDIHSMLLNRSSKRARSPGSDKDNWRKKDFKTKSSFKSHKKAVTNVVVLVIILGIVDMLNVFIVIA